MLGSSLLVVICILLIFFLIRVKKPKNFPPGPPPVPIFGSLLQLNLANPLKDFEKFAEKYGEIFSLYTGSRPAVILNSFAVIKEALVTKAQDFSGRPQDFMISHATENKGIVLADYGPVLKGHRRFALMTMRNFGLGKQSMEERILGEISHVVDYLDKNAGKRVDPHIMFHNVASNVISLLLFGCRFDYNSEFLQCYIQLINEISKIINGPWNMIYDTFPLLRILPLPFKKAFDHVKVIKSMNLKLIDEHKSTRVPGEPRDFIDCYLDELDKGKNCVSTFSEDKLLMSIMDLHFAGTDTISNTLLTAFLYLMNHPEVQVKCQQEIDDVLEGKDRVMYEDRHNMPYTLAVIHEVQRVANTVPLSVFHSTTRDTELMGYSIPKGTIIIPNLTRVLKEEGQWKFPYEFNPANFLNEQGQFEKPEAFIPFSTGLRMCLGEGLARMELFLIFVALLRRFQFEWPVDAGKPDYTPVFGLTLTPKPYRMHIRRRETVKQ
ncbi:cytochrome P450 2X6 [Danio rerio]|uniref:Cytochrome P450 2X6 n=1 Tax=Danio rerio TaxID=7955 RepID=Q5BLJ2_DANRE|nr:cytochrome P450 2X6 [Danio rerio]AAH90406.1 Zgc:110749 [Danio rerio]|eukprot:NP_001013583.1 cytochrome P450, family 2, subfamily X, polypeptide 6 [Danio rerio]